MCFADRYALFFDVGKNGPLSNRRRFIGVLPEI